jgi:hypothetical protein
MRITVDGDFKKLEDWERALASADKLLTVMSRDMAEEALNLTKEGWRKQANPYGKRWKGKKHLDGRQVLVGNTARLKGGWYIRKASRSGFTIAPSVGYAGYHQTGAKHMVQRLMVPVGSRGLPQEWRDNMKEIIGEHFSAHFGSKRAVRSLKSKGAAAGGMGFVKGRLVGMKRRFNLQALMRKAMKAVSGE